MGKTKFEENEVILYINGSSCELGVIKRVGQVINGNQTYFVFYHTGATASCTHERDMHKIVNLSGFDVVRKKAKDW